MGTRRRCGSFIEVKKKKIKEVLIVKRLYKSRKNKMIDGVCGGIAEYFDVDPVLVRLAFVLFFFVGGSAIVAYIVGMIIIPRRPLEAAGAGASTSATAEPKDTGQTSSPTPQSKNHAASTGALVIGVILIVFGAFFLMGNFHFFRSAYHWFWHHFWDFLLPAVLIITGIALIFKSSEKKTES